MNFVNDNKKKKELNQTKKNKIESFLIKSDFLIIAIIFFSMVLILLFSKNGDGIIALVSFSLLIYNLIVKEKENPYIKFSVLIILTCIVSIILAVIFVRFFPNMDLNKYSTWISGGCLLWTFVIEANKIRRQICKEDEENSEK